MLSSYLTFRSTRLRSKDVALTELMEELTVCVFFIHMTLLLNPTKSIVSNMISFTAYMSSPCHIELILSEKEESVKKEVTFIFLLW